jgi:hypothetical protein
MGTLIQVAFSLILLYFVTLIYFISKARTEYTIEKRRTGKYNSRNQESSRVSSGSLLPQSIIDFDPAMEKLVDRHNRLVKIYQISGIIGVPLLIFLGWQMTKL